MVNKKALANYAVGLMALIAGVFHLINNEGRPDGKWEMILGPVYDVTGDVGYSVLTILLGLAFVFIGYLNRDTK